MRACFLALESKTPFCMFDTHIIRICMICIFLPLLKLRKKKCWDRWMQYECSKGYEINAVEHLQNLVNGHKYFTQCKSHRCWWLVSCPCLSNWMFGRTCCDVFAGSCFMEVHSWEYGYSWGCSQCILTDSGMKVTSTGVKNCVLESQVSFPLRLI